MNCENITITDASRDDLRDVLDLLSVVQLPHDGVAENVAGFSLPRTSNTARKIWKLLEPISKEEAVG